jgi:hypothetical protein
MLKSNFLNNFKFYGEALYFIEQKAPHKLSDLRQSYEENHVEAASWLVEELIKTLENCARQEKVKVLILNSWLGMPIVPLLCENIDVGELHLVDLDREALDISKIMHKHYAQEKFVKIRHHNLDIPFAFDDLNKIDADIVIAINTEQMYPLEELVTRNPMAVFACQNSNVIEEMYGINCVNSIEDLRNQIGLEETFYEGQIEQTYYSWDGQKKYDRFMVIGSK